jgi:hypothetical protein
MVGGLLLRCVTFLPCAQNSDKYEAALVHNGQKQVNQGTMQIYKLSSFICRYISIKQFIPCS